MDDRSSKEGGAHLDEPEAPSRFLAPARLLQKYGLVAKKSFGQCFLHDRRAVERIVEAVDPRPDELIVEIGAGLGALTSLLAQRAARVIAIERDRDLVPVLRQELATFGDVEVCEADALSYDYSRFSPPVKVVGNLPYNISSPLLFRLLEHRRGVAAITVMLQRELAERLAARPGGRLYGVPTVTIANVATLRICFHVKKGAFVPAPKVDSTVIQLLPRSTALFADTQLFERTVRAAFSMRRKKLKSALRSAFTPELVSTALERAGVSGDERAERVPLEGYLALSEALAGLDAAEKGDD